MTRKVEGCGKGMVKLVSNMRRLDKSFVGELTCTCTEARKTEMFTALEDVFSVLGKSKLITSG